MARNSSQQQKHRNGQPKVKQGRKSKARPSRKQDEVQSLRRIIQVVPAPGWEAICWYPGSPLIRAPLNGWALVEELRPRMSLVTGFIEDGYLWDEQPECVGYAHQSKPLNEIIARWGKSLTERTPLADRIAALRMVRLAGMVLNAEYPSFKATPEFQSASNDLIADKVNNMDLPDERRRIVAIMPTRGARAIYSVVDDTFVHYQPLTVWVLAREADGTHVVAGMDAEHFLCDEWPNFLRYEPRTPEPEEFRWMD